MGRRKRKREKYDEFIDEYVLAEYKDDRKEAEKIKNEEQLQSLVKGKSDRAGAIGLEIKRRNLVTYGADGKARVNADDVQAEAAAIKRETLGARFYPKSYLDEQPKEIQERYSLGRQAAKNIIAGDAQIRARAVLTAAAAGNVKIDPNTKGILNNYAAGRYEQAIYGNVEETTGKRTYEKGRYFSELGFSEKDKFKGAGTANNTPAAKAEQRQNFIENVLSSRGTGNQKAHAKESFVNSHRSEPSERKESRFTISDDIKQAGMFGESKTIRSRAPKENNLSMFTPEEMTGKGKRSNMFGDFRGSMGLEREDPRTQEEKDRDRRKDAESRTGLLFKEDDFIPPPF